MFKFTFKINTKDLYAAENNASSSAIPNFIQELDDVQDCVPDIQTLDANNLDAIRSSSLIDLESLLTKPKSNNTIWLYIKIICCVAIISQISNSIVYLVNSLMNYTLNGYLYIILNSLISGVSSIVFSTIILVIYNKISEKNQQKKLLTLSNLKLKKQVDYILLQQQNDIVLWFGHQLRNPLQVLSYALDGLNEELKNLTLSTVQLKEILENAMLSFKQMQTVLNAIVEVLKIETEPNLFLNEETTFTLINLVELVFAPIKEVAIEKQLELICKSEITFNSVCKGDLKKITDILTVFLINSAKFTQPGGFIKLFIRFDNRVIVEEFMQLHFSVQDNGVGIENKQLKQIFIKPFCAALTDPNSKFSSIGLGLKKAYILANNSNIIKPIGAYSSGYGKGAIFWTRAMFKKGSSEDLKLSQQLILEQGNNIKHSSSQSVAITMPNVINVLIVEDSAIIQRILHNMLNKLGCNVTAVSTGEEAIEIIKQSVKQKDINVPTSSIKPLVYDLIFMDIVLPGKDGKEIACELRKLEFKGIIVACTGNGSEKDRKECFAAGMDDFILKPVVEQTLSDILDKFFASKKDTNTFTNRSDNGLDLLNQGYSSVDLYRLQQENIVSNNPLSFKKKSLSLAGGEIDSSKTSLCYTEQRSSGTENNDTISPSKLSCELHRKDKERIHSKLALMPN